MVKTVCNVFLHVLHNFYGFAMNTTVYRLGGYSLRLHLLMSSMVKQLLGLWLLATEKTPNVWLVVFQVSILGRSRDRSPHLQLSIEVHIYRVGCLSSKTNDVSQL